MILAFSQVIPKTFFCKSSPNHNLLGNYKCKNLKKDRQAIHYITVVNNLCSTLDYDSTIH